MHRGKWIDSLKDHNLHLDENLMSVSTAEQVLQMLTYLKESVKIFWKDSKDFEKYPQITHCDSLQEY